MEPERLDLNRPPGDGIPEQPDHSCVSGPVQVVFRDHRQRLLELFEDARGESLVCVGALYRLSDLEILDAMAQIPTSIVVQKETLWRPDLDPAARPGWRDLLREHYDEIAWSDEHHELFLRQHFPSPLGDMKLLGDQQIAGVRCIGVLGGPRRDGRFAPLMHHKYLVFARLSWLPEPGHEGEDDPPGKALWEPTTVWSGSYNLSRLASRSRENGLIIRDPVIAGAFFQEWVALMCLSEALDWQSNDISPEWHEDA